MSPTRILIHLWREARALVEEGLAALPVLGPRIVPAWTVIQAGSTLEPAGPAHAPTVLRLPPAAGAFEREIRIAGAGEADIERTVELNLDRWSPFAPSDTLYAVVPGSVRRADGLLAFRLALASRARVEAWVAAAREAGIAGRLAVDAAGPGRQSAAPPYDLRTGARPRTGPVTAAEGLLTLGIGGAIAGLAGLAVLAGTEIADGPAGGELSRAAQIDRLKRDMPSAVESLAHIAAALPDATVLEELRFDTAGVVLAGRSGDAASLPVRLEQTGVFEQARLVGALMPDAAGGERFELSARHARPGARR